MYEYTTNESENCRFLKAQYKSIFKWEKNCLKFGLINIIFKSL